MTGENLPEGWIDAFLDTVRAFPTTYRGQPALALSWAAANPRRLDEVEPPHLLVGMFMAERRDGRPLCGNVFAASRDGFEAALQTAVSSAKVHTAFHWMSGAEACLQVMAAHAEPHAPSLGSSRWHVTARLKAMIGSALPLVPFSAPFREALGAFAPMPSYMLLWLKLAFDQGERGHRVRAHLRAYPVLSYLDPEGVLAAADLPASALPKPYGIEPSRALMAWLSHPVWDARPEGAVLSGAEPEILRRAILELAAISPPEWLPRSSVQARALIRLAEVTSFLPKEELPTLMSGCGGDWVDFADRCESASGHELGRIDPAFVGDPVTGLVRAVVTPVVAGIQADATHAPRLAWIEKGLVERHGEASVWAYSVAAPSLGASARWLLYRDKALPGVLATAREWHDHLPGIRAGIPSDIDDGPPWPALFEPTDVEGVALVPLTSARELESEGSRGPDRTGAPGLDHCVASYKVDAAMGWTHIVSVRRNLPGGGYERLATAEIVQDRDGELTLVQLQGRGNREPPVEARLAVATFIGDNPLLPFIEPREREARDPVRTLCGYDWTVRENLERAVAAYAFLLPRDLRSLDALRHHLVGALPPR